MTAVEAQARSWALDGRRILVFQDRGEIVVGGSIQRVPPMVMDVLVVLILERGRVVEKQELIHRVWGNAKERGKTGLPNNIYQLRRVLEDDSANPRIIENIPKRGYRLIAECEVLPASGRIEPEAGARSLGVPSRLTLASVALWALALLILIGAGTAWIRTRNEPMEFVTRFSSEIASIRAVTSPAISFDGEHLAFVQADREFGDGALMIAATDASLVEPQVVFTEAGYRLLQLAWAPDNRTLALSRLSRIDGRCEIGLLSLPSRRSLPIADCELPWADLAWSPDGSRLAFAGQSESGERSINVYSTRAQATTVWSSLPDRLHGVRSLTWSEDGESIFYTQKRDGQGFHAISEATAQGPVRMLLQKVQPDLDLERLPGSRLLVSSRMGEDASAFSLIDAESGRVILEAANPIGLATRLAASATGKIFFENRIERVDILEFKRGDLSGRVIIGNGKRNRAAHLRPADRVLAYVSDRDLSPQVWLTEVSNGRSVSLTHDIRDVSFPRLSSDARSVAFIGRCSTKDDELWVCLVDVASRATRALGELTGLPATLVWSADDAIVVVLESGSGQGRTTVYGVEGNVQKAPVFPEGTVRALPVQSGRWVLSLRADRRLHVLNADSGKHEALDVIYSSAQDLTCFDVVDGVLYYLVRGEQADEIRRLELDTYLDASWTLLPSGIVGSDGFTIDPHRETVTFSAATWNSDIRSVAFEP